MSTRSAIEWTESTWNPLTGCTKVSAGCRHCYAEPLARRLKAMGQPNYANGFRVTCHDTALQLPLAWRQPRSVFVNSMSDLFHEDVPTDFILRIFEVMRQAEWHRFQILTKRSSRLLELDHILPWSPNIWMGVTVENTDCAFRIDDLRRSGAAVKFLSLEPLLGPISNLDLTAIDWVIVGGESGVGARPMERSWVVEIRDRCRDASVPFFFKQWGGVNKKKAGRELDGRTWSEMPGALELSYAG